ncbi:MAG TPA: DUF6370 family protein [Edaphocola sp.]|nr:DUF6370 family protein [Edaphocola sp.]
MKAILLSAALSVFSIASFAQSATKAQPDPKKKIMKVEASCGECNFGLPGESCDLAVKIDGKAYYVDGANIMDYGHPHDKGGFCVAVRKAEVQGEVVDGRFKASYFKLLKEKNIKSKKSKH